MATTISIKRGDDWDTLCTFTINNVPLDVRGYWLWFTAKLNVDDSDEDAVIQYRVQIPEGDITPEALEAQIGNYLFWLPRSHTDVPIETYFFDFQLMDLLGKVKTVGDGKLKITQDVTITTSIV